MFAIAVAAVILWSLAQVLLVADWLAERRYWERTLRELQAQANEWRRFGEGGGDD